MVRLLFLTLLASFTLLATGCETTSVGEAGKTGKNVIKEVTDAYGNVQEGIDKTKTWVNTKVNQAEQATEDVQEAAESLNNAVNSLREFTSLGGRDKENSGEEETTSGDESAKTSQDEPVGEVEPGPSTN